jgi:hypothetical protein
MLERAYFVGFNEVDCSAYVVTTCNTKELQLIAVLLMNRCDRTGF